MWLYEGEHEYEGGGNISGRNDINIQVSNIYRNMIIESRDEYHLKYIVTMTEYEENLKENITS